MIEERAKDLRARVRAAHRLFLATRLDALRESDPELAALAERAPRILAVSKFQPVEAMLQAKALGFNLFGENRVQELRTKREDPRLSGAGFDLIGSLQTNKVKHVVGKVRCIQSLDRPELAAALAARAAALDCRQSVLLQVNFSREASKHGLDEAALFALLEELRCEPRLELRGLMTMAAPGLGAAEQRDFFSAFFALFLSCRRRLDAPRRALFTELSMGMSEDFEAAVACGSRLVRIGSALFGRRLH